MKTLILLNYLLLGHPILAVTIENLEEFKKAKCQSVLTHLVKSSLDQHIKGKEEQANLSYSINEFERFWGKGVKFILEFKGQFAKVLINEACDQFDLETTFLKLKNQPIKK